MNGWESIVSAPKDGTKFIAFSARNGLYDHLRWVNDKSMYEGHFESLLGYGNIPIAYVTHWMPLPEPPK